MNNKILIVLAALVVAGGAWWFINNNSDDQQASVDEQASQSNNELAEIDNASIEELLAQNKNMLCTYNYSDDNGSGSGTIYFSSDQRMRGQFTYEGTDGETQTGSIIQDGETQYFWDETTNEGFKMELSSFDEMDDSDDAISSDGFDTDEDYSFDCSEWQVDESIFAVPSDVEFTDFSAQLEQLQQNLNSSDASAACAQLETAEQRAACEAAF